MHESEQGRKGETEQKSNAVDGLQQRHTDCCLSSRDTLTTCFEHNSKTHLVNMHRNANECISRPRILATQTTGFGYNISISNRN